MSQEQPDKKTVAQKLKNFHTTHAQVLEEEVQYWMDFKTILTPTQNKQFWNMFEQSRVRRQ